MKTPERIYLRKETDCSELMPYCCLKKFSDDNIEYIRSGIAKQEAEKCNKALAAAYKLLWENLPLIRDVQNRKLKDMAEKCPLDQDGYNAIAAIIHLDNKEAYILLEVIEEFLTSRKAQKE